MKKFLKANKIKLRIVFLAVFAVIYLLLLIYVTDLTKQRLQFIKTDLALDKISTKYSKYRIDSFVYKEFKDMTLEDKVGQMFMLSLPTAYYDEETKSLIEQYSPGGVVLMDQNITSQPQLTDYVKNLQKKSNTKLFIATDQEGGIVARIPWDSARYISQPHIGTVNREDFAYSTGESHAKALKEYGLNVNLAPVLDISSVPGSTISYRSLGSDPGKVTTLGMEIIKAHQDNQILVSPKHFPGIGRTNTDSHTALPEIDITKDKLLVEEIVPFKEAISNDVKIIMVGHALYPKIDKENPSSLSKRFLQEILREFLKYDGIVLTDDIHMGALDSYPDKITKAIKAGNDMIMIVDSYENQVKYMKQLREAVKNGEISEGRIDESVKRILKVKIEEGIID